MTHEKTFAAVTMKRLELVYSDCRNYSNYNIFSMQFFFFRVFVVVSKLVSCHEENYFTNRMVAKNEQKTATRHACIAYCCRN